MKVCFILAKIHQQIDLIELFFFREFIIYTALLYYRFYSIEVQRAKRLPNEYKVRSSCLRTNRLQSHDVKSPCSYFILQIKQGFIREFGLRCQRGPLQSCLELRKKSNRKLQRGRWRREGGGGSVNIRHHIFNQY